MNDEKGVVAKVTCLLLKQWDIYLCSTERISCLIIQKVIRQVYYCVTSLCLLHNCLLYTDVFGKAQLRQDNKKAQQRYISHMWGEDPANDNATKFGTGVDVQDIITHAKF